MQYHSKGQEIEVEVWEIPFANFGQIVAEVPAPLGIGNVQLADGSWVKGFICEGYALEDATDISHFGGWRDFIKSKQISNTRFKCNWIGKSHNDQKATLAASVCCAIFMSGCDNTAKVPESSGQAKGSVNTQPIRIGYSDWPGWVAWQVAIEKAG